VSSGILPVDKPAGETSFAVVRAVKRATGEKRVGHAGTLDPAATGLLLVCIGQGVRVSEYLMDMPKVYRARVRLGAATDTYDAEGSPTLIADASGVTEEAVRAALCEFLGEVQQAPPSFSAIKVQGQAAYRLARRGQAVTLAPRAVRIYRLDLLSFESPDLEIEVECGKGTYIRSLAHDIGMRLGCGAHLAALRRTRIGPFEVDSAAQLPLFLQAAESGCWPELLLPVDSALLLLPSLTLSAADEKDIRHGQAVRPEAGLERAESGRRYRAYAEDGSLVGIVTYDGTAGLLRPQKVFSAG
jgi:tRNA pseudouridine55 synthase